MSEQICAYCKSRKGKRKCPALLDWICSQCCGLHRFSEINCPNDCGFGLRGRMMELARAKMEEAEDKRRFWIPDDWFIEFRSLVRPHPVAWDFLIWRLGNELAEVVWNARGGVKSPEYEITHDAAQDMGVHLATTIEEFICDHCSLPGSELEGLLLAPFSDASEALSRCRRRWKMASGELDALIPPDPKLLDVFTLAAHNAAILPSLRFYFESRDHIICSERHEDIQLLARRTATACRQFLLDAFKGDGRESVCIREPYRCGALFFTALPECHECRDGVCSGISQDPREMYYQMMPRVGDNPDERDFVNKLMAFTTTSPWCAAEVQAFVGNVGANESPRDRDILRTTRIFAFASRLHISGLGKRPVDMFIERQARLKPEKSAMLRDWADAMTGVYSVVKGGKESIVLDDLIRGGDAVTVKMPSNSAISDGFLIVSPLWKRDDGAMSISPMANIFKPHDAFEAREIADRVKNSNVKLRWLGRENELMECRLLQKSMARAFANKFGGALAHFETQRDGIPTINEFLHDFIFEWRSIQSGMAPADSFRLIHGCPPAPKQVRIGDKMDDYPMSVYCLPEIGMELLPDLRPLTNCLSGAAEPTELAATMLRRLFFEDQIPPQFLNHLRETHPGELLSLLRRALNHPDFDYDNAWPELMRRCKKAWESQEEYPCWFCVLEPDARDASGESGEEAPAEGGGSGLIAP
ncbi:MAG TPA: hypothetical protein PL033_02715 [Candidatus Brocadiia bacterium]|nr:hypothetical protein [Candidatus Brocadiia bacterium]